MTPERKVRIVAIVLGAVAIASFIFFMSGGVDMLLDLINLSFVQTT